MSDQLTIIRYAIVDGRPSMETSSWVWAPDDPRACRLDQHNDPERVNGWLMTSVSQPLVESIAVGAACLLDLAVRDGVKIITEAEFHKAVDKLTAAQDKAAVAAVAEGVAAAQAAWDARAARYTKIGFDEADVIAEIGPRPQ